MTAGGQGDAPRVTRLILRDYRSYEELDLGVSRRLVALSGENGAGKTNLLEAVSLFTPGRGLRRAEFGDMARSGAGRFAVSLSVMAAGFERRLGTGLAASEPGERGPRVNRIDGADVASAAAFAEHLRIVWLTPDVDGLFRGAPADRRRFLDRLVLAVDARHGARVTALERVLRSRNRLLEEGGGAWLDAVERELAEVAVAIAAARRETAQRLDAALLAARDDPTPFPFARLALVGEFEAEVAGLPAVDAEDAYRAILRSGRARDGAAGRTIVGPHAIDLAVRHGPKDAPAAVCSTGEQKALLLRLILAHAKLVQDMSGLAPLVLLDEVAAHLDPARRDALFDELERLPGQVWMSGADPALFASLAGRADLVRVTPGRAAVGSGP